MANVNIADFNPLKGVKIGGSMESFSMILLVFLIVVFIVGCIGFLIYVTYIKKQFYIRIRVFRKVGNVPTEIALFKAREIRMGMAGDKLWRVAPNSFLSMPFKIIKWLPVGKKQTAKNEFWYWIREDGEWINFIMDDLDDISEKMKVKFIHEDMRLQRLATDRLLEQRLMQKTFWEKWGNTIMTIIFFLVIAVCMVIIFYQWSKLLEKMTPMISSIAQSMKLVADTCSVNQTGGGLSGLVPA